jgi:rod shape-determining protein MreC
VVNVYGLIGRTVEVGERSTRVILLTDFNSRIAVMADRSNARALLVGDNSEFPAP